MLVIASGVEIEGKGTGLLIALSNSLAKRWARSGPIFDGRGPPPLQPAGRLAVGPAARRRHAFTLGLPSMSADRLVTTKTYRVFLLLLATVPMAQLTRFRIGEKAYAVVGASSSLLAVVLLVLNGRRQLVGEDNNRPWTVVALLGVLLHLDGDGEDRGDLIRLLPVAVSIWPSRPSMGRRCMAGRQVRDGPTATIEPLGECDEDEDVDHNLTKGTSIRTPPVSLPAAAMKK